MKLTSYRLSLTVLCHIRVDTTNPFNKHVVFVSNSRNLSMPRSCQASLHILGSHTKREAWWYTTPLASQLIRKQVGGFIFDVGLLRPCGKHAEEAEDVASMPRTLQSMPRTLRSMPRRPRTLPSMPRSCQASLHILGSHK